MKPIIVIFIYFSFISCMNNEVGEIKNVADNNEERVAQVCFKGYELGSRVENFPVKNARRGIHKNYELTYNSLQSLDKLLEFVRGNSPFSSL